MGRQTKRHATLMQLSAVQLDMPFSAVSTILHRDFMYAGLPADEEDSVAAQVKVRAYSQAWTAVQQCCAALQRLHKHVFYQIGRGCRG